MLGLAYFLAGNSCFILGPYHLPVALRADHLSHRVLRGILLAIDAVKRCDIVLENLSEDLVLNLVGLRNSIQVFPGFGNFGEKYTVVEDGIHGGWVCDLIL
jgi:hypothetical protein